MRPPAILTALVNLVVVSLTTGCDDAHSVVVLPKQIEIGVGQQFDLTASAVGRGNIYTPFLEQPEWSTTDPTVVALEGNRVTGLREGTAKVIVSYRGLSDSTSISVGAIRPTRPATGPLEVSRVNPRYFATPDGEIVYLTGAHTWANFQDSGLGDPPIPFDYKAHLDYLSSYRINFMRLWTWEQAQGTSELDQAYWFTPNLFLRTGPGLARDGKPRFDLTRFNPDYFDRMRRRAQEAGERGIYVSIMLFDGWSVATKPNSDFDNPWEGHPFNADNNINGIDGDPDGDGMGIEAHSLEIPEITRIQEEYVKRVIDAVNDLDNVLYEISNESEGGSAEWQYHLIRFIREYEATLPKQHPIGMTLVWPNGSDDLIRASEADWISPSGDVANPPPADGAKVVLADTDHQCGVCGDVAWVWKSFTRGQNPVFMDGYDGAAIGLGAIVYDASDPLWEAIRRNLAYTRSYADRIDLARAAPHGELASSVYCLAVPGSEYLVFIPGGGPVTVDLTAVTGKVSVEWFDPATGQASTADAVDGGGKVTLTPPSFSGDAVLYLRAVE